MIYTRLVLSLANLAIVVHYGYKNMMAITNLLVLFNLIMFNKNLCILMEARVLIVCTVYKYIYISFIVDSGVFVGWCMGKYIYFLFET